VIVKLDFEWAMIVYGFGLGNGMLLWYFVLKYFDNKKNKKEKLSC